MSAVPATAAQRVAIGRLAGSPIAVGPASPDTAGTASSGRNNAPCAASPSRPSGAAIPLTRTVRTPVRVVIAQPVAHADAATGGHAASSNRLARAEAPGPESSGTG